MRQLGQGRCQGQRGLQGYMGQTEPGQEDRVDQDHPGQGTKKGSGEDSGFIYVLCPGEWDGMGRWGQCWRGHWKIGLVWGGRWGRQGGRPCSQGTDVGSSEQPTWRCHRTSQPAQVTGAHPSWKQAGVGSSGGRDLARRPHIEVHEVRNAGSDPH